MTHRLGIITGLASEIRSLEPWRGNPDIDLECAGADAGRAAALAGRMAERGCRGLVSFGIAGALDRSLATGTVLLPERVAFEDRRWACTDAWRQSLERTLADEMDVRAGILAGSPVAVRTTADKAALNRDTGAVAIDMESHAVAAVAAERGLPFLVVRVVADPRDQEIPSWMPELIDDTGHVRGLRTAVSLLTHPGDWFEVDRLRRQSRVALDVLGRVAVLAGPRFGFAEFGG